MRTSLEEYFKTYTSLNFECKMFIFLYFLRSYSAGIVFYISIYFANMSLNSSLIGYQISSLVLGNLLGSLFATSVLNNNNVLKLSGLSLLIKGICFISISLHSSIYLIALSVFFLGFFGYLFQVCSHFLITGLSGIDKVTMSKAITSMSVFANLGLCLGGISVSLLSKNHAQFLFLSTGILLILISIPYFRNKSQIAKIMDNNLSNNEPPELNFLVISLLTILIVGIIFAQQRIGLGIFLTEHFSGLGMSSIITLNSLMIIFILPILRPIIIRGHSIITMGLGVLLLGGGMYLIQYISSFYSLLLLCIIWTIGEMIANTLSHLLSYQCSKKERRGNIMGLYKFLYALGTFVGAIVGARILQNAKIDSLWSICGIFGFIMFIITVFAFNYKMHFSPVISKHTL